MIKSLVLASYGVWDGSFVGDMFSQWEQYGFFSYILPFLLIFAIIFGILQKTKIFDDNKSIAGIIAFVVGLMALQFPIVPEFFAEVFPRFGIGLSILLIAIILLGILSPDERWTSSVFYLIGVIILVAVLVYTAGAVGWSSAQEWYDHWPAIVFVLIIIVIIAVIVGGGDDDKTHKKSRLLADILDS